MVMLQIWSCRCTIIRDIHSKIITKHFFNYAVCQIYLYLHIYRVGYRVLSINWNRDYLFDSPGILQKFKF